MFSRHSEIPSKIPSSIFFFMPPYRPFFPPLFIYRNYHSGTHYIATASNSRGCGYRVGKNEIPPEPIGIGSLISAGITTADNGILSLDSATASTSVGVVEDLALIALSNGTNALYQFERASVTSGFKEYDLSTPTENAGRSGCVVIESSNAPPLLSRNKQMGGNSRGINRRHSATGAR